MKDLKAVKILCHTLVDVPGKPPLNHGNCFTVIGDDGKAYSIVNFVYENVRPLVNAGLTWPIDMRVIGAEVAVIHDKRIPSAWYRDSFCESCCPRKLLPMPQTLQHEREVMQGVREERDGYVTRHFIEPKCLVKPG